MAKKGEQLSEVTRKRIKLNHARYWKGKKLPKELIERRSEVAKENGFGKWMKGRKLSEETRLRMSVARSGSKNPSWKGGVSKKEGYKNFYDRIGKARRRGAGGSHTFEDWERVKAEFQWTCPACKRCEPEIKLTIDHIIPITKGGTNHIHNIQPLCNNCNARKQVSIVRYSHVHKETHKVLAK